MVGHEVLGKLVVECDLEVAVLAEGGDEERCDVLQLFEGRSLGIKSLGEELDKHVLGERLEL